MKTDCLAQIVPVLLTRRGFPSNRKFWFSRISLATARIIFVLD